MFKLIIALILIVVAYRILNGNNKPKQGKFTKRRTKGVSHKNVRNLNSNDISVPYAEQKSDSTPLETHDVPVGVVEHKRSTHLTTENERRFHEALRTALPEQYVIHCQVSLMALVQPVNYKDNSKTWAKRMDFVITDQETKVVCVIELDDKTHEWKNRQKRDKYVNEVLDGQHPLVRFESKWVYEAEMLLQKLTSEVELNLDSSIVASQ